VARRSPAARDRGGHLHAAGPDRGRTGAGTSTPRDQIEAVLCRVAELYPGKVRYLREERDGQLVEDDPECPGR
jgi:hypothetical protein